MAEQKEASSSDAQVPGIIAFLLELDRLLEQGGYTHAQRLQVGHLLMSSRVRPRAAEGAPSSVAADIMSFLAQLDRRLEQASFTPAQRLEIGQLLSAIRIAEGIAEEWQLRGSLNRQSTQPATPDSDPNAPWLSLAHTVCAEAGIPPGHISHRLEQLRDLTQRHRLESLAAPAAEPQDMAAPVMIDPALALPARNRELCLIALAGTPGRIRAHWDEENRAFETDITFILPKDVLGWSPSHAAQGAPASVPLLSEGAIIESANAMLSTPFKKVDAIDFGRDIERKASVAAAAAGVIKAAPRGATRPVSKDDLLRLWLQMTDRHVIPKAVFDKIVKEVLEMAVEAGAIQPPEGKHTYVSTQATHCAGCGKHKHTPLRIDAMGGYVCLTCIDNKLGALLGEFGHEQEEAAPDPVLSKLEDMRSAAIEEGYPGFSRHAKELYYLIIATAAEAGTGQETAT